MKRTINALWIAVVLCFCAIPTSSHAVNRQNKSSISPWIVKKGDVFVYQFNVFNLVPDLVSMEDLKSILKANQKDINTNYKKDYGIGVDIKLYPAEEATNPDLFNGDRIPFYIFRGVEGGGLAFHSVQASEPANSQSFLYAGDAIPAEISEVPSNFPDWTPWAGASALGIKSNAELHKELNDPYGIKNFLQELSFGINHELKELLFDDSIQNWVLFDTFAPTVASWHYAEFDENGKCINGRKGKDGFVHLPFFLDVFPAGGLLTTIQENGDAVSRGSASKLQAYKVDGWSMTNYPESTFWKGYFESKDIKWDKKGFVEAPLQPFAGLHESLLFLDFSTGDTIFGNVNNFGPVTYRQRGDFAANNFPPDYTYVTFFFDFNPAQKIQSKKLRDFWDKIDDKQ